MRHWLSKYVVGPAVIGMLALATLGNTNPQYDPQNDPRGGITVTVTSPEDLSLVPWRPVAMFDGTTNGVMFNNLFLDKRECDAYLTTAAFKQSYTALGSFLQTHASGSSLGSAKCVRVSPTTPPPQGL